MIATNLSYFANGMAFMFFAFAGASLLRYKKKRKRADKLLGYMMLFWAFLELKDLVFIFDTNWAEEFQKYLFMIDGWGVAICSFYLMELTKPKWITLNKLLFLLLPFACFTTVYFVHPTLWIFQCYCVFLVCYSLITVIALYTAIYRYQKHIRNFYSYSDNIDIKWIREATAILVICLSLWIYTTAFSQPGWGDLIYYLSSIAFWAYIIHHAQRQVVVDISPADEEAEGKPEELELYRQEDYVANIPIKEMLTKVMEEEKPYLNPKLTLTDVANAINTNRTYLSIYFNNILQISFYDYINSYRIEKVSIPLLESSHSTTIEEIAELSGFNAISTFRRAFIKNTGVTPLNFRKTALQKTDFTT